MSNEKDLVITPVLNDGECIIVHTLPCSPAEIRIIITRKLLVTGIATIVHSDINYKLGDTVILTDGEEKVRTEIIGINQWMSSDYMFLKLKIVKPTFTWPKITWPKLSKHTIYTLMYVLIIAATTAIVSIGILLFTMILVTGRLP